MDMWTMSENLTRAPMTGLVVFLLLALVPTPGLLAAETEPFSDEAESMREAARQAGVPEHELPLETPAQSRMRKVKREPWEQKTTSAVRHVLAVLTKEGVLVAGKRHEAPQFSITGVAVDYDARVLVECKVDSVAPFDADFFASIGGILVDQAIGYGMLVAWIPADRLPSFAGRDEVRQVRHIDPPYTDVGAILTEGDAIHRADDARDTFSIDGTGQLVGVISDGVSNLAAAQGSNDLPAAAPVTPGINVPPGCTGSGDEGTAMLEIVWDLAPGADLAFCTGFPGTTGMVNAINTLAGLAGMTIITDDLPHPQEPVFEDGPIAQAVDRCRQWFRSPVPQ